jgi:hypothetical protein
MLQAAKKGLITTFGHHANPHTHSRRESSGDLQTGKLHRSFTALPWFSHLQLEGLLKTSTYDGSTTTVSHSIITTEINSHPNQ